MDLHEQVTRHLKTFKMSNKMIISLLSHVDDILVVYKTLCNFFKKKTILRVVFC